MIEEFEKLGRNARNELFWDGEPLVTKRQLQFTWPQIGLAVLAALASIATVATGLNNASIFLCARGNTWLGCPALIAAPIQTSPAPSR